VSTVRIDTVLHHLRRAALRGETAGLTDGQLLERYLARRDEASFEALVQRHGPMVLGVCRRILGNEADAEDAFQAAFLVLVRKAAAVMPRDLVGNWLYGVASNTARKARSLAARRLAREREIGAMARPAASAEVGGPLHEWLDAELQALPDRYRVPIVLCELEGKTRKQTARLLGWAEGTVASRLSRGRTLLAQRLRRRGLGLSAAALGGALANEVVAGVPVPLVNSTVKAAALFAAGSAATGVISAPVVILTEGVLKTMLLSKLKFAVTMVVVLGATGVGLVSYQASATGQVPALPGGSAPAAPAQPAERSPNPALPVLIRALKTPDPALRAAAAEALGKVGKKGDGSFDALVPLLKDSDANVRAAAVRALQQIAPGDRKSAEDLRRQLQELQEMLEEERQKAAQERDRYTHALRQLEAARQMPGAPAGPGQPMAFSGDGSVLAVARGRAVDLIDAATGKLIRKLELGDQCVSLAFAPVGNDVTLALRGFAQKGGLLVLRLRSGRLQAHVLDTGKLVWTHEANAVNFTEPIGGRR
jgi:RNA polymerase sigma factor (sigma-70 family)